ncbi:MAG TPA: winged helix DNA-binding domain-containing protein [Candidatus Lustribacter sp.]|nr:winged helix DNA-binding domain-containing protein [Candidatus Lustribacter sp.]
MSPGPASLAHTRSSRMASLGIAPRRFTSPAAVVLGLGAVQAQDYAAASWALGLRCASGTLADVVQAVTDREVVRTWPMRGTLHLVPAADAGWMCHLLTGPPIRAAARLFAHLGLTEEVLGTARGAIERALTGGVALSRPELFALLAGLGIDPSAQRGIHLLGRFSQQGLLCQGVPQGRQPTFTLLEEWVPGPNRPTREEALATLARRYVGGHGPVTERDFAWWTGQTLGFAREAFGLIDADVERVSVDGPPHVVLRDAPTSLPRHGAHLLPGYDELILGYQDRSATMDAATLARVVPGSNGVFQPTILANGRVVGTWTRMTTSSGVVVTARPFAPLSRTRLASVGRAAASYGRFLGAMISMRLERT